jgi:hypothetical protein
MLKKNSVILSDIVPPFSSPRCAIGEDKKNRACCGPMPFLSFWAGHGPYLVGLRLSPYILGLPNPTINTLILYHIILYIIHYIYKENKTQYKNFQKSFYKICDFLMYFSIYFA